VVSIRDAGWRVDYGLVAGPVLMRPCREAWRIARPGADAMPVDPYFDGTPSPSHKGVMTFRPDAARKPSSAQA